MVVTPGWPVCKVAPQSPVTTPIRKSRERPNQRYSSPVRKTSNAKRRGSNPAKNSNPGQTIVNARKELSRFLLSCLCMVISPTQLGCCPGDSQSSCCPGTHTVPATYLIHAAQALPRSGQTSATFAARDVQQANTSTLAIRAGTLKIKNWAEQNWAQSASPDASHTSFK